MLKITLETDKPLIAVVDDEKEITELLAEELQSEYQVIQFNVPQRFIEAIKTNVIRPAVLVTDLKMPVINGLEMLKQLSEIGFSIPTVMFSGYLDKDDAIKALELGVIHILEKPIDTAIVHEVVSDSLIDWELVKTRKEIRDLTKQVKEIYSTLRFSIANYVPKEIVDKVFIVPGGKHESFDELLESLEAKLEFLMREETLLSKIKQTQYKNALAKQAGRI
jgi:FixJ family two-component response regulator